MKVSNGDYYIEYANPCTYDGELVQGAEYKNGQYVYHYKQKIKPPRDYTYDESGNLVFGDSKYIWQKTSEDDWGISLTDGARNAESITTNICTSINDKSIVNVSCLYADSQATSIDLSNFNTSNVTNMGSMFSDSQFQTIYVSDKWSTTNVNDSGYMFYNTTNLVGGAGTRYSSSHIDKTYARVDDSTNGKLGYFTYKAN